MYLAGGNSFRIRKALASLLGEQNLSKSSISRVVGRLKALFAEWNASSPYRSWLRWESQKTGPNG